MRKNSSTIISISEVNKNFSQLTKKVDDAGHAIILKNNKPQYYITKVDSIRLTDEEKVLIVARRILKKYDKAFKELAK